jgi:signal peptidase I
MNKRIGTICVITIIVLFLVFYNILNSIFGNNIYLAVICPLFWLLLFLFCYISPSRVITKHERIDITQTMIISAISYIILYFLLGLIFGFQYSPYKHDIISIGLNIWLLCITIPMEEYVRSYLVKNNSNNSFVLFLITILFTFVMLNFGILQSSYNNFISGFKYTSSQLFTTLISNFLLSYVVLKTDSIPNTIYRLLLQLVLILTPIMPNLDWYISAVINLVVVTITYIYIKNWCLNKEKELSIRDLRKNSSKRYIPFYISIILFILFVAGIFSYQPITIMSNSMFPEFKKGDVLIVKKIKDKSSLNIGDIIEFKHDKIITHRIVNIYSNDIKYYFKTKGDNNLEDDNYIVKEEDIVGKVEFVIPGIGYPSVMMKELFE